MIPIHALLLVLPMPGSSPVSPGVGVSTGLPTAWSVLATDEASARPAPGLQASSVPILDIGGHGRPSAGDPTPGPAGGSYRGPGDTIGGGAGAGPTGGGAPSTGAPSAGGAGGGRPRPGGVATPGSSGLPAGSTSLPNPVTLTTTSDDTWWLWWEFNKNEFLTPNRLGLGGMVTSGDDPEDRIRLALESARDGAVPLFTRAAQDRDAGVRGAATIALGRVGGAAAVPTLLASLADANQDVRHQAILALGATGAEEALAPLLALARTGSLDGDARHRVSPFARPLAVAALGLARRTAIDDRVDVEIVKLLQARTRGDREEIGVAAMIYATLAPSPELERWAFVLARDEDEAPSVRCRAVEALRHVTSEAGVAALAEFLASGRLDLRRSAALALGHVTTPAARAALRRASESETEPLTRGFVLVSIGRRGGEDAHATLARVLEKGDSGARRWAALALGIAARNAVDAEQAQRLAAYLRAARELEKGPQSEGAFAIAAGLARDGASRAWITRVLTDSADPRQRMYAASALALLGTAEDVAVLRGRLALEPQVVARVAIADALGFLGHAQDVPAMTGVLMQLGEPALQGLAASAMATHGSREALVELDRVARLEEGSRVRRSAAIAGLGMMLAAHRPFTLAEVSRESNYTVFSEWIGGMFQTTL